MNVTDRRQTDRRQTDGRMTTYSEHELEFTFAKNRANFCLTYMNRFQVFLKLVGMSRNKHLIKLFIKCPLHLEYVLALPWEI